jgi:penicillin-binding protein 1A
MFPNKGMSATPHALLEVRNGAGDVIWRWDRDGPKPKRVIPEQVALDLNMMLNKAAEEGTGRRAMLDGIRIAGKTGTTNDYHDGWFVGYTGNMVAGVWFGNDDYSPTARMTGGSLPAMTRQRIMAYAHQGIELKPIPGVESDTRAPQVASNSATPAPERPQQPPSLSRRGADVLVRVERMFDDATRALASKNLPTKTSEAASTQGPLASADRKQPSTVGEP